MGKLLARVHTDKKGDVGVRLRIWSEDFVGSLLERYPGHPYLAEVPHRFAASAPGTASYIFGRLHRGLRLNGQFTARTCFDRLYFLENGVFCPLTSLVESDYSLDDLAQLAEDIVDAQVALFFQLAFGRGQSNLFAYTEAAELLDNEVAVGQTGYYRTAELSETGVLTLTPASGEGFTGYDAAYVKERFWREPLDIWESTLLFDEVLEPHYEAIYFEPGVEDVELRLDTETTFVFNNIYTYLLYDQSCSLQEFQSSSRA